MRIRFLLSSTAFVTLSLGLGTPGYAQKGVNYEPTTQWSVTKVAGNSGQGGYCALAKRFKQNTILTFAKNQNSEMSFAVDFQGPKFSVATPLKVSLDPGAGQQRDFSVAPASSRAFVVRLGRDDAFLSALEKTGYLRAEIGTQTLNFNLADIDEGQTKLNACIADMVMPAAGDETTIAAEAVTPMPAARAETAPKSSLRQELMDLRLDVQKLKNENARLSAQVNGGAMPPVVAESASAATPEAAMLSRQLEDVQKQNDELRLQLAEALSQSSNAVGGPAPEDLQAMTQLREENAKLKALITSEENARPDTESLRREIETLRSDNDRMRAEMSQLAARSDAEAIDGQQLSSLKAENERLKTELQTAGRNDARLTQMQAEIDRLQSRNSALENETLAAAANKEISDNDKGMIEQLKRQIEDMTAEAREKDARLLTLSALSVELETLKKDNETLRADLGAATPAADVAQKIQDLESENARLSAQVEKSSSDASGVAAQEIAFLKSENDRLKNALETVAGAGPESEALKSELAILQKDYAELQQKLTQQEAEFTKISAEQQKLFEENTALKETIASSQSGKDDAQAALKSRIEELEQENERLSALPAPAAEDTTSADALREGELADLRAALAASREDNQQLSARIAEMEKAEIANAEKARAEKAQEPADDDSVSAQDVIAPADTKAQDLLSETAPAPQPVPEPVETPVASAPLPGVKPEAPVLVNKPPRRNIEELEEALRSGDYDDQMDMQETAREYMRMKENDQVPTESAPHLSEATPLAPVNVESVDEQDTAAMLNPEGPPSEASRQEERLRQSINEAPVYEEPPEEDIVLRQSQDPFDDIKAEDDFQGYALNEGSDVQELHAAAAAEASKDEVTEDAMPAELAAPPAMPSNEALASPAAATEGGYYRPAVRVQDILNIAGIVPDSAVEMVADASGAERVAYQWQSRHVYGSAEQQPIGNEGEFDTRVKEYLEKTQQRCQGDFAVAPDNTQQLGGARVDSYEIACVGNGISSSASLMFFAKEGTFTALAHEAPAEEMAEAMNIRDRLMSAISGS